MSLAFAEGVVTRSRREFKLVLPVEEAGDIRRLLSREVEGERPRPTLITSVYFDWPGLPLAARALATPHNCLKIRTKEYFPDLGAQGEDRVVLELKRERSGLIRKRRAWVPRRLLSEEGGQLRRGTLHRGGLLLPLIARGSLLPTLAVTYLREVYQRNEAWRVTVDTELRFYPVSTRVVLAARRIGPHELGRPALTESRVVIEVKHLGTELPAWLFALQGARARYFSKFASGMGHLYPMRAEGVWG